MILSTIAATAIVFSLSRAVGDPLLLFATSGYGISDEAVAEIRKELALDRSYPEQYLLWLSRVLRGDLGQNLAFKLPVARIITEKIPHSLQLGTFAWFFSGTIGVGLGVLSAVKRASLADYGGRFIALIGQSIPVFWFAIILIMVFAVWLDWLPAGLAGDSHTGTVALAVGVSCASSNGDDAWRLGRLSATYQIGDAGGSRLRVCEAG